MSKHRSGLIGLLLLAGAVGGSRAARADIPPPGSCVQAGTTCQTAGTAQNETGTCRAAKCQHATPDGSVEYDCVLCQKDSATGGASGSAGGAAGTAGAAGATGTTGGQSDGCNLAGAAASRGRVPAGLTGIFSVLVALVAGTWARRRRR